MSPGQKTFLIVLPILCLVIGCFAARTVWSRAGDQRTGAGTTRTETMAKALADANGGSPPSTQPPLFTRDAEGQNRHRLRRLVLAFLAFAIVITIVKAIPSGSARQYGGLPFSRSGGH